MYQSQFKAPMIFLFGFNEVRHLFKLLNLLFPHLVIYTDNLARTVNQVKAFEIVENGGGVFLLEHAFDKGLGLFEAEDFEVDVYGGAHSYTIAYFLILESKSEY